MTTRTKFLLIAGLSAAFVACKKTATSSMQSNAKFTAAKQDNLTGYASRTPDRDTHKNNF